MDKEDSPEFVMHEALREILPEIPLSSLDEHCGKGLVSPGQTIRKLGWSPVYPLEASTQQDALRECDDVMRADWYKKAFTEKKYWNGIFFGNQMSLYVIVERLGGRGVWGQGVEGFMWNDLMH